MERIGKYIVHKAVPTSGCAKIFLCQDPDLAVPVALKLFAPKGGGSDPLSAPQWLSRFQAEARILAQFEHPHIIAVKAMETLEAGRPFLVMPYMAANLSYEIGKDRPTTDKDTPRRLPLARAVALLRQVASALTALHRRGYVHRALKPSNLLLTARENGQIKLADFTLAKLPERNPPLPDHWLGGTEYCAPEQRENATGVDARADVYSLGVLAYRLVGGALPDPTAGAAVLGAGGLGAGVPQALVDLVAQATDPDPARRPGHGGAFLQALGQVPVEAAAKPKVQIVPVKRVAAPPKAAATTAAKAVSQ